MELYLFFGAQTEPEGFQSKWIHWYSASAHSVYITETIYFYVTALKKIFKKDKARN